MDEMDSAAMRAMDLLFGPAAIGAAAWRVIAPPSERSG
jgi:hypothetical protein